MAKYTEAFTSKLDWAMPFQRTGKFPIDRSSMFESYADALAYAKQDGTDKRGLGGSSYIGQIVTVFGPDAGTVQTDGSTKYVDEVAAYIITAVGESASLMKLAQTTSSGDFGKDIQALQTSLSNLETTITERIDNIVSANTSAHTSFDTRLTTLENKFGS